MPVSKRRSTRFLKSLGAETPSDATERIAANMLLMANPSERYCFGVDLGTPCGDHSVAVLAQKNADGTVTILGAKEVQPFDIDLPATDITDQKLLQKPE